eukprot:GFUD01069348.1.p1 GENE.GFUD01069348.1~~GFUD01069348.1.p1  ORF type:complete len:475 (-),score=70.21 GFUD01069348.1:54-1478(-)
MTCLFTIFMRHFRAFFRRSIGSGKDYRYCSRKTDACVVDAVSRTNCKKCRFQKCLLVGMKPEKVDRVRKKNKNIKTEIKEETPDDGHPSDYRSASETKEFLNFRDNRRSSSESSHDSSNSVDISALAEECIIEEVKLIDKSEGLEKPLTLTLDESNIVFDLKEDKIIDDSDFFENNLTSILYNPTFHLTFEEDFKIYELLVRKENLVDGFFRTFMELPDYQKSFEQSLLSIQSGTGLCKGLCNQIITLLRKYIITNFLNGGVIRQSLDMFDEYKNVDESVKAETFFFSMSVFHLCLRAILKANRNKETFVNQHRASGTFTNSFEKACSSLFPHNIHALASVDPLNISLFASPWAVRYEDEQFFCRTLETVGSIIKDDVKLGTLYCTLVLSTPGINQSKAAQNDPSLLQVQREMTILIFRYLSHKFGNSQYASNTTSALTKLVADLHLCREIHLFGRLNGAFSGPLDTNIEDLKI